MFVRFCFELNVFFWYLFYILGVFFIVVLKFENWFKVLVEGEVYFGFVIILLDFWLFLLKKLGGLIIFDLEWLEEDLCIFKWCGFEILNCKFNFFLVCFLLRDKLCKWFCWIVILEGFLFVEDLGDLLVIGLVVV